MIGFWASFLASALLAWPILQLLRKMKSRQVVSQHAPETHQVKQGTPTMGGLIILAGWLVGCGIYSVGWRGNGAGTWPFVLILAFAAIGFVDDFVVPRLMPGKRGLGWKQKILMQVVAALAALPALRLEWTAFNVGVVLFVVLFCSNAYNFADGLDGLAGSLAIWIALTFVAVGAGRESQVLLLGLIGSTVVFLFINAPPAKVFMGDVGSLPIGAFFGLAALDWLTLDYRNPSISSLHADVSTILALCAIFLVLVAELVPVPLQIFWVKVFKRKLFPYTPIHHAFEKAGWPESRVVWTFVLTQLLCSAAGLTLYAAGASGRAP